jgi:thiol-disulfide isomerase/thioredoxin
MTGKSQIKRIAALVFSLGYLCFKLGAQTGYDIKINLKGCKDTIAYLAQYTFDQTYIIDTCKTIRKDLVEFKGKKDLDKGVCILVNQDKAPYFEFFVNESQKFTITANMNDVVGSLNCVGSRENEQFFSYMKYGLAKNKEFGEAREKTKGKSREDSTRLMNEKIAQLNADVKKFDAEFLQQVKGTFLYDFMNLKTEKLATEIPKAKNGRPDSLYQYYYYKSHFFDGVDFKDERIARTPYLDDRIKKYFDNVVVLHPDTVIGEIDKLLSRCNENNLNYRILIGYFTYKYEQSKVVGFDKVFVHLADNYILNGKTGGMYSESTVKAIKERVDIMRNLLEGKKVPDLFMIDTVAGVRVRKMGFDTASSAKSITDLYYKNEQTLTPLFKTLYQVDAKYTVLIFWSADCGHCQTEIPKLHESLKELKGKADVKVFAVQTKDEIFDTWRKFIVEHKLTEFTHVFDPVHLNNCKDKFDVFSTPVIYILDRDKKVLAKKLAGEGVVGMIRYLETREKKL